MFVTCVCSGRDLQLMQKSGACREHVFFFLEVLFRIIWFFCWRNMCSYRRNVGSSGEALGKLRGSSGKIWGSSGEIPRKFRESGETFTSQVFIFINWNSSPSQLFTVIIFYYFIDHCHSAFLSLPDYEGTNAVCGCHKREWDN